MGDIVSLGKKEDTAEFLWAPLTQFFPEKQLRPREKRGFRSDNCGHSFYGFHESDIVRSEKRANRAGYDPIMTSHDAGRLSISPF
jgi:hypothetical protein